MDKMQAFPGRQAKLPTLHTHRVHPCVPLYRAHMFFYSLAILALVYHRASSLLAAPSLLSSFLTSSLLLSELVLAVMWAGTQALRWQPVRRREHPERLPDSRTWPPLDVFVCTADPHKEPPASVAATALSVMAFDYPTDKLSVYVSDDGGSEVTLFAFMEAARFARYWLPFCREMGIVERSPEAFFASDSGGQSDKMKMMYTTMKEKVENALERGHVNIDSTASVEEQQLFKKWKSYTRNNHPSVIKVLLNSSRDTDITGTPLPNLIYVSREKRPGSPHHFKAGALNVLLRVSNALTNAPIVLTLDCDMRSNDPTSPSRALCYFLDPTMAAGLAFVQFPQVFNGLNKSDIYGSEIKRLFKINLYGFDGLSGPNYLGTNAFHSRRALSGGSPRRPHQPELESDEVLKSARAHGLLGLEPDMARAVQVASCDYEFGTTWGSKIGLRYGSLVEDYYTGYRLHCEGWKSVFCRTARPEFLGEAPKTLHDSLGQSQRWVIGLHEVTFSRHNTILFGVRRASLLMGLGYTSYALWGFWSVPVATYGLLPQLALVNQMPLFPKASDPWFYLYAYLFVAAYGQDMADFVAAEGTMQRWWSDQRMWLIRGITSHLFATIQFALKQVGISTHGFNVTSKVTENEQVDKRYDQGLFEFGAAGSPFFFTTLGTAAVLSLAALAVGIAWAVTVEGALDGLFAQLFLTAFVVANGWPVYEAMFFRCDGGRMPPRVTAASMALAALLLAVGFLVFNV